MHITTGQLRSLIEGILAEDIWARTPSHDEVIRVMREFAANVTSETNWNREGSWPDDEYEPDRWSITDAIDAWTRLLVLYKMNGAYATQSLDKRRLAGEYLGMVRALPDRPDPWFDFVAEALADDNSISMQDRQRGAKIIADELADYIRVQKNVAAKFDDDAWVEHTGRMAELW